MQYKSNYTKKKQWVRLTQICNNNCIFCLDKETLDGTLISFKDIKSVLAQGRKRLARIAVLSGGEPTLHPNFHEIIIAAKNYGYKKVQVVTNGRMFAYNSFLQNALESGLNEITFSIFSHEVAIHDALTRAKGSFLQSLKGLLNALQNQKIIVNIDIVVTKMNLTSLSQTIVFFKKLGVREFDIIYPRPLGAAWENRKNVFFTIEEGFRYLKSVFQMSRKHGIKIWANKFPSEYLRNFPELNTPKEKIFEELEEREDFFNFREEGKVMSCFGTRCSYCFFKKTCIDIFKLYATENKINFYEKEVSTCTPA